MTSILDGELAGLIGDALLDAGIPLDVVLTRTVVTADPEQPWNPPTSVTTTYPCWGFTDEFTADWRAGGLVAAGDVRIVIVAQTLGTTPQPGDRVTVRGETYQVIEVGTDPAAALWSLQGRA